MGGWGIAEKRASSRFRLIRPVKQTRHLHNTCINISTVIAYGLPRPRIPQAYNIIVGVRARRRVLRRRVHESQQRVIFIIIILSSRVPWLVMFWNLLFAVLNFFPVPVTEECLSDDSRRTGKVYLQNRIYYNVVKYRQVYVIRYFTRSRRRDDEGIRADIRGRIQTADGYNV